MKNKKMTSKLNTRTIKTVLFIGLIMTLMIPITAIDVSGIIPEKISDDRLMERSIEFSNQYKSMDEFTIKQNAITEYVNADLQLNGWNQFMVKENIRIYNFDTILGKVGYGHELVALFAAKDRLQGNYIATEPVTKFHDWLISKYNISTSLADIDKRIETIVPNAYMQLAIEDVSSFNNMANQGNVPPELLNLDSKYWTMVANVAVCQYDDLCDYEGMHNALNNKSYETKATPMSFVNVMNYFLPEVYASTNQPHSDYVYANPNTCDYGTCWRSASWSGTGVKSLSINSGGGHGFGALYVYASTCSTVSGATKIVSGTVNMGTVFYFSKTDAINTCATSSKYFSLPNPNSSYLWTVTSNHNAVI